MFFRYLRRKTNSNNEHVCDADLHFIPGQSILLEMERCVAESAVFVIGINPTSFSLDFGQIETSGYYRIN